MDLTALEPLAVRNPETLADFDGRVLTGRLGATTFIVTVSPDGRVEASLSTDRGRPATDAQVAAFFRRWGHGPKFEDRRARGCRMFVVRDVRPAYNN